MWHVSLMWQVGDPSPRERPSRYALRRRRRFRTLWGQERAQRQDAQRAQATHLGYIAHKLRNVSAKLAGRDNSPVMYKLSGSSVRWIPLRGRLGFEPRTLGVKVSRTPCFLLFHQVRIRTHSPGSWLLGVPSMTYGVAPWYPVS